jgi:hypothetical protein
MAPPPQCNSCACIGNLGAVLWARNGEQTARVPTDYFGAPQPAASRHLRFETRGLVLDRRVGRLTDHSVQPARPGTPDRLNRHNRTDHGLERTAVAIDLASGWRVCWDGCQ